MSDDSLRRENGTHAAAKRHRRSALRLERMARALVLAGTLALLAGCEKKEEAAFEVFQTPPPAILPRHWQVPDFSLVQSDGTRLSNTDLRGKVWVADFFYTTCPGPCPMMSSRLQEVHAKTRGWNDVMLVSISTDPAKDTPEVLQQYAKRFGADERWRFLTGTKPEIFDLANKGFKLSVTEDGTAEEPITHSTKLVLVDKNGTIRGFYDGLAETDAGRLLQDIDRLRKESR